MAGLGAAQSAMNPQNTEPEWLSSIAWNDEGLVTAVAQERGTGVVLMVAWMNREALALTLAERRAVYWSRSRKRLWRKGEESGHVQRLIAVRLDCDGDAILLEVEQEGGTACHTGRRTCFFRKLDEGRWLTTEPVLTDPETMYGTRRDEPA